MYAPPSGAVDQDVYKRQALRGILSEIKEKETDATLKLYYNMFDEP